MERFLKHARDSPEQHAHATTIIRALTTWGRCVQLDNRTCGGACDIFGLCGQQLQEEHELHDQLANSDRLESMLKAYGRHLEYHTRRAQVILDHLIREPDTQTVQPGDN